MFCRFVVLCLTVSQQLWHTQAVHIPHTAVAAASTVSLGRVPQHSTMPVTHSLCAPPPAQNHPFFLSQVPLCPCVHICIADTRQSVSHTCGHTWAHLWAHLRTHLDTPVGTPECWCYTSVSPWHIPLTVCWRAASCVPHPVPCLHVGLHSAFCCL
jgi:hypothetical protein